MLSSMQRVIQLLAMRERYKPWDTFGFHEQDLVSVHLRWALIIFLGLIVYFYCWGSHQLSEMRKKKKAARLADFRARLYVDSAGETGASTMELIVANFNAEPPNRIRWQLKELFAYEVAMAQWFKELKYHKTQVYYSYKSYLQEQMPPREDSSLFLTTWSQEERDAFLAALSPERRSHFLTIFTLPAFHLCDETPERRGPYDVHALRSREISQVTQENSAITETNTSSQTSGRGGTGDGQEIESITPLIINARAKGAHEPIPLNRVFRNLRKEAEPPSGSDSVTSQVTQEDPASKETTSSTQTSGRGDAGAGQKIESITLLDVNARAQGAHEPIPLNRVFQNLRKLKVVGPPSDSDSGTSQVTEEGPASTDTASSSQTSERGAGLGSGQEIETIIQAVEINARAQGADDPVSLGRVVESVLKEAESQSDSDSVT